MTKYAYRLSGTTGADADPISLFWISAQEQTWFELFHVSGKMGTVVESVVFDGDDELSILVFCAITKTREERLHNRLLRDTWTVETGS